MSCSVCGAAQPLKPRLTDGCTERTSPPRSHPAAARVSRAAPWYCCQRPVVKSRWSASGGVPGLRGAAGDLNGIQVGCDFYTVSVFLVFTIVTFRTEQRHVEHPALHAAASPSPSPGCFGPGSTPRCAGLPPCPGAGRCRSRGGTVVLEMHAGPGSCSWPPVPAALSVPTALLWGSQTSWSPRGTMVLPPKLHPP